MPFWLFVALEAPLVAVLICILLYAQHRGYLQLWIAKILSTRVYLAYADVFWWIHHHVSHLIVQAMATSRPALRPMHPSRAHIHENVTVGDKVADGVANVTGSWRYIISQNIAVLTWIAFNIVAVFGWHWDPYPFILLNLVFSWQASNSTPILQLTQNRQARKDRMRDDQEAREVEQSTVMLQEVKKLAQETSGLAREMREIVADLHTHTTCLGHTTVGDVTTDPIVGQPTITTPTRRPRASKKKEVTVP